MEIEMNRRKFLTFSSIAAAWLITGCGRGMGGGMMGGGSSTIPDGGIKHKPLPIPVLLQGSMRAGTKHYDLDVRRAKHDFFNNILTDTFGINGSYLGPTLLMRNGDNISVNYSNHIGESITMHGHGMHLPSNMDGTAHQQIRSGNTWSAKY